MQREAESQSANPEQPPKLKPNEWPKMFEAIEDYLRQFNETIGVPLSYIVRKNLLPASNWVHLPIMPHSMERHLQGLQL